MSQISRKWLADEIINGDKLDSSGNYRMHSLVVSGDTTSQRLLVPGSAVIVDSTVTGMLAVTGSSYFGFMNSSDMTAIGNLYVSGRVGIGTTNPQSSTHIVGNLDFEGVNVQIFNRTASSLLLGTNNTERVRITSDGRVGIGTTNPQERIHIVGNLALDGTNAQVFNRAASSLLLGTNNTERVRITSDGKVGIGTTSPLYKLHISDNSGEWIRLSRSDVPIEGKINASGSSMFVGTVTSHRLILQSNGENYGTLSPTGSFVVTPSASSVISDYGIGPIAHRLNAHSGHPSSVRFDIASSGSDGAFGIYMVMVNGRHHALAQSGIAIVHFYKPYELDYSGSLTTLSGAGFSFALNYTGTTSGYVRSFLLTGWNLNGGPGTVNVLQLAGSSSNNQITIL